MNALRSWLSVNPWLRLFLPFSSGIAAGLHVPPENSFYYGEMYLLLFFLFLAFLLSLYRKQGLGLNKWIPGGYGLLFLCCAGFQLARSNFSLHKGVHFSHHDWQVLWIQVSSIPENSPGTIRFRAEVMGGYAASAGKRSHLPQSGIRSAGSGFSSARGSLQVTLLPGKKKAPVFGDELLIKAAQQTLNPPENPAEFDYQRYLSVRAIHHQVYLKAHQWLFTGENNGNPLLKWANRLQQHCIVLFDRLFSKAADASLLSALVLGYREGVDPSTNEAFRTTGTVHILSVSGLHVAILYGFITWALKPLKRISGGRIWSEILAGGGVILYAFITGLSAPVCRASCMILLYTIARMLKREPRAINLLALTAFLLLTQQPSALADIGFQLSFMATAGLLIIFPGLKNSYRPRNPLINWAWSMTAVSFSAQLATFPLIILYFHVFPVYFLPANLLLVPLATLLLYGGILLLALSGTGPLACQLAEQLSGLIAIMKNGMDFFTTLPGALTAPYWISPLECLSYYLLIICLLGFWHFRKAGWALVFLWLSILLSAYALCQSSREGLQRKIIYFRVRENIIIGFLAGKEAVLVWKKPPDRRSYNYSIRPYLEFRGIRQIRVYSMQQDFHHSFLIKKGGWLQFFDQRLWLKDDESFMGSGKGLSCDFLLITENTYLQMDKIRQVLDIGMIINGPLSSKRLDGFLKKFCRKTGIGFHSLKTSGALLIHLENDQQEHFPKK